MTVGLYQLAEVLDRLRARSRPLFFKSIYQGVRVARFACGNQAGLNHRGAERFWENAYSRVWNQNGLAAV